MMRLPDFLVIGAVKAGTTWVWNVLRDHPEVYVPEKKEIRFFNVNWHRGVEWYADWFQGAGDRVAGEVSPEYLIDREAARRIRETVPDVRLIVILRNPVDRAYSHVRMHCNRGSIDPTDIEGRITDDVFIEPGLYGDKLSMYLDLFDRQQLQVVKYADLAARPTEIFGEIFEFLGVSPIGNLESINRSYNRGKKRPRSVLGIRFLRALYTFLARRSLGRLAIDAARKIGLVEAVRGLSRGEPFGELSPSVRRELVSVYRSDVEKLSRLLERDFSGWLEEESHGV